MSGWRNGRGHGSRPNNQDLVFLSPNRGISEGRKSDAARSIRKFSLT